MPEDNDSPDPVLEGLSRNEQRLLAEAIKQVERTLFERAAKRLRTSILVVMSLVGLFGVVSVVGVKTTIIDQAARRLSENPAFKKQVVDRSVEKLDVVSDVLARTRKLRSELDDEVADVLRKARRLRKDLDRESSRLAAMMNTELDEIHSMIGQVLADLEQIVDARQAEGDN